MAQDKYVNLFHQMHLIIFSLDQKTNEVQSFGDLFPDLWYMIWENPISHHSHFTLSFHIPISFPFHIMIFIIIFILFIQFLCEMGWDDVKLEKCQMGYTHMI